MNRTGHKNCRKIDATPVPGQNAAQVSTQITSKARPQAADLVIALAPFVLFIYELFSVQSPQKSQQAFPLIYARYAPLIQAQKLITIFRLCSLNVSLTKTIQSRAN